MCLGCRYKINSMYVGTFTCLPSIFKFLVSSLLFLPLPSLSQPLFCLHHPQLHFMFHCCHSPSLSPPSTHSLVHRVAMAVYACRDFNFSFGCSHLIILHYSVLLAPPDLLPSLCNLVFLAQIIPVIGLFPPPSPTTFLYTYIASTFQ